MAVARGFDILRQARTAPLSGRPSPGRNRLREQALAMARDESLVAAAYSYRIVDLQAPAAPLLHAGGESLEAPWLLERIGGAQDQRLEGKRVCIETIRALARIEGVAGVHVMGHRNEDVLAVIIREALPARAVSTNKDAPGHRPAY